MHSRAFTFAPALLVLASVAAIACRNGNGGTAGASLTGPSSLGVSQTAVTAEPAVIVPEFRAGGTCVRQPPFDARLNVAVRSRQELFIRSVGFEFFDRFGRRALPLVIPGFTGDVENSIVPPIPVPTTHPIPFPGQVLMSSVLAEAGALRTFPFRLRFDCGVPAHGTLFVSVETADRRGTVDVSRISAPIGD